MGFSLFVLFQGLSAPVIGALIARMGARFTMTIGAVVMLAASLCMVFVVTSPAAYFACFGVLASVGAMMAGQLSVQSTVGAWFVARRGVAMTATMFVGASSAFLLPPVIEAIIGATGGSWRGGWYLLIGLSVVMIPVAFFLVKDKPSDVGQLPDGSATVDDMAHQRKTFKVFKREHSLPFAKAVRTPAFWLISLAATGGFAAYSFASSQGVIHFTTIGLDRALIVAGVSVMGGAGLVGKVVMGSLSDRVEPVRLVSASAFLIAAGTLVAAVASNPAMMYAYYFCTGFGFGAISADVSHRHRQLLRRFLVLQEPGSRHLHHDAHRIHAAPDRRHALRCDPVVHHRLLPCRRRGCHVRGMRVVRSVPVPSVRVGGRSVRGFFGRLRVGSHIGRRRWPMARRPARQGMWL